ncbi:hypothetical protein [Streptomyces sp. NPDC002994]
MPKEIDPDRWQAAGRFRQAFRQVSDVRHFARPCIPYGKMDL